MADEWDKVIERETKTLSLTPEKIIADLKEELGVGEFWRSGAGKMLAGVVQSLVDRGLAYEGDGSAMDYVCAVYSIAAEEYGD
jgi:hypothetical protein